MPYSHTTFGELKTQLASRLNDTSNVFWLDEELGAYLHEALRVWNSTTGMVRGRDTFHTTADVAFYDLNAQLPDTAPSITDRAIIAEMQHQLMETRGAPTNGSTWLGGEMFTYDEFRSALQRRRNQFLLDTGCRLTHTTGVALIPPATDRLVLPQQVADLRRLVWRSVDNVYHHLFRGDELLASTTDWAWTASPGTPHTYSMVTLPQLYARIIPPAYNLGTCEYLSVNTPADINPAVVASNLLIPDDYVWGVKYGALADLLKKDGPARDHDRAAFCESLYQMAVLLCQNAPLILHAEITGIPALVDTVLSLDTNHPGWEEYRGVPETVASAGRNMVALYPPPDAAGVSVSIEYVTPVTPLDNADHVQIGKEYLNAILAWAQMAAQVKVGGTDLLLARQTMQDTAAAATAFNERLVASGVYVGDMFAQSTTERNTRAPRVAAEDSGSGEPEEGQGQGRGTDGRRSKYYRQRYSRMGR